MNVSSSIVLSLIFALGSLAAADGKPVPAASSAEAEEQARAWLDNLGKRGLVVEEVSKKIAFKRRYNKSVKSTSFQFSQEGWWVSVAFSGEVTAKTSLKELRKRVKYVALDKVPTPGLEIPGWQVKPRTPTSSFKKGVEIEALKDGVLSLKVKTECFALYGTDPKKMALVPADAGAPKAASFHIRKSFPLELKLSAPLELPGKKALKKK